MKNHAARSAYAGPLLGARPVGILISAVIFTQLIATLVSVYGLFMTPIGWYWALMVWLYAL